MEHVSCVRKQFVHIGSKVPLSDQLDVDGLNVTSKKSHGTVVAETFTSRNAWM